MLRCINCHLCVDRMLRHVVGSFQSAMQTLLATWTPMEQLPPEAVICQECFLKLNGHFRNNNMNAQRELGHTKVCLGCGTSILKSKRCIRHHRLDVNDPLTATILSWDIYNEVTTSCAFVCHSCWIHANRQRSQDLARDSPATEIEPQLNDSDEIFVPRQEIPLPPPPPPPPPSSQEQQIPTAPVSIIILPHYKRLSNTSRHSGLPPSLIAVLL